MPDRIVFDCKVALLGHLAILSKLIDQEEGNDWKPESALAGERKSDLGR